MGVDDEHPEIPEIGMSWGRQCKSVAYALARFVRSRNRIERQGEVAGGSRQRADHAKIALPRHRWRRRQTVSARGDQAQRWLVSKNSAEMRRRAYRATDVGSERKRAKPRSDSRSRSARRAAGRAADIPGIVGGSVDIVIALELTKPHRDIGLADDDFASPLQPRNGKRIFGRHEIPEARKPPGRRQSRDIECLLQRHGNTEQRSL